MTEKTIASGEAKTEPETSEPIRLHLGCGQRRKDGWVNIDLIATDAADLCFDLGETPWPFEDESVEEAECIHTLEHLEAPARRNFFNELYRVLEFGGRALIVTPHWKSPRAIQDPTHRWPPIPPEFYFYTNRQWREANLLDHYLGYSCDFDFSWGDSLEPDWQTKSVEATQFALRHHTGVSLDLHVTLTKPKRE